MVVPGDSEIDDYRSILRENALREDDFELSWSEDPRHPALKSTRLQAR